MATIIEKEVKTFKQYLICECGSEMKFTGTTFLSNPAKYQHQCLTCDKHETHNRVYPTIIHRDV